MVFQKFADHGKADGLSRLPSEGPPVVPDPPEIVLLLEHFRDSPVVLAGSPNKNPNSQGWYIISCI